MTTRSTMTMREMVSGMKSTREMKIKGEVARIKEAVIKAVDVSTELDKLFNRLLNEELYSGKAVYTKKSKIDISELNVTMSKASIKSLSKRITDAIEEKFASDNTSISISVSDRDLDKPEFFIETIFTIDLGEIKVDELDFFEYESDGEGGFNQTLHFDI